MKPNPPSKEKSAFHDTTDRQGAGILVVCRTTKRFLISLRGPECSQSETWAPFGGMVDPGETPSIAAPRELQEEAGIVITPEDQAEFVDIPLYVNKGSNGFTFSTYVLITEFEPKVTLNEESSGYGWFGIDKIPTQRLHPGFAELLQSSAFNDLSNLLTNL